MNYGMVPPPSSLNSSASSASAGRRSRFDSRRAEDMEKEQQYNALTSGYTTSNAQALAKKRTICDDDYFENASDEDYGGDSHHSSADRRGHRDSDRRRRWDEDDDRRDRGKHPSSSSSSSSSHHRSRRRPDDAKDEDDDFCSRLNFKKEKESSRHSSTRSSSKKSAESSSKNASSNPPQKEVDVGEEKEEEEDDPLDAFMADIDAQAKRDKTETQQKIEKAAETGEVDEGGRVGRGDIDDEDMQESYFKFLEEYTAKHVDEDDDIYEYDEDGNVVWTWKKVIDPLPAVDHSTVPYQPFQRDVYAEHADVGGMSALRTFELRNALDVRVYGPDPPKPVSSFAHFSFDEALMRQIRKSEFEKPTAIQAQAIPAALKGRDVLGLARTGSGKTLAYIWPAIVHIMEQDELAAGEGPIALVVVPTRELAIQVYQQAKVYCRPYNINVVCAYGGGSKYEQKLALEEGAELVICTPGRIIDMVSIGATNFYRTTFLVFDEVDRMFDLGFEPQVKSIADHIRPDRQCLMFSATMRKKVEKLVVHALENPIKIVCGDVGEANADVQQVVHVLANSQEKWNWLNAKIVEFCSVGKLLIFVTKKVGAEEVAKKLKTLRNIDLVLLHGDMLQQERNEQITAFRAKCPVMIATDVAARGLDIPEIKTVVNFDVARDIDTHVHRIGRTGRAGQQGTAHTLVTEADFEFCGHLAKNLESVGQFVSPELMQLAQKSTWFKTNNAGGGGSAGAMARQRMGLGYKPKARAGFGQPSASSNTSYLSEPAKDTAKPSISKIVERAKGIADSNSGSGLSRIEMMRTAMKSSFQFTFHKASSDEWSETRVAASDPRPEWQRQLAERAAAINQAIGGGGGGVKVEDASKDEPPSDVSFGQKKKRSRWQ